jgi:hypothetical protein
MLPLNGRFPRKEGNVIKRPVSMPHHQEKGHNISNKSFEKFGVHTTAKRKNNEII